MVSIPPGQILDPGDSVATTATEPLAVLVDAGSASASEAGRLRAHLWMLRSSWTQLQSKNGQILTLFLSTFCDLDTQIVEIFLNHNSALFQ